MSAIKEKSAPPPASDADEQPKRRAQILDAALKVFGRDGFDAARTDAIAKKAGASKGTLYNYFSSKEEMFEEAVRMRLLPLVEQVEKMQEDYSGTAEVLLRMHLTFIYDRLIKSDLRNIMRMLIAEGDRFPNLIQFYHDTVLARGAAAVKRTLRYGVEKGEFRPDIIDGAEKVIMGPAMLAAIWTLVFNHCAPLDIDRHFKAHIDIILNGLKQR